MEHNQLATKPLPEEPTTSPTATPQVMPGSLAARIALAMRHTRTVPLDGYNGYDKYRYTKNATVLEYCGAGMAAAGLAVIPLLIGHEITQEDKKFLCRVDMDLHIVGAPGEVFVSRWTGYGDSHRTAAMALKVAITNCHVSFVSKLFMLGAEDGGENDADDTTKPRKQRYQSQPQPGNNGAGNGDYPKNWSSPMDAQGWLKSVGFTPDEARAAWVEAVRACGSYSEQSKAQVFAAFYATNKPSQEQPNESNSN